MIIKHKDIINSILEKKVKDRKKWEHQFLIKYNHQGNVRNYLLSMGEFKEDKKEDVRRLEDIDWSKVDSITSKCLSCGSINIKVRGEGLKCDGCGNDLFAIQEESA